MDLLGNNYQSSVVIVLDGAETVKMDTPKNIEEIILELIRNLHNSVSEIWPYFPHALSTTNPADGTKKQMIGSLEIFS